MLVLCKFQEYFLYLTGTQQADEGLLVCYRHLAKVVQSFVQATLKPKGNMILKFHYREDAAQWAEQVLKPMFAEVHYHKSSSRRPEPRESFWVCKGFKGAAATEDAAEREELETTEKHKSNTTETSQARPVREAGMT